jgi:deoxyribonuclease-1
MKSIFAGLALVLALCASTETCAQQTTIKNYTSARKIFWKDVYPNNGALYSDIYCGFDFRSRDDVEMQVEHAYPANWMAKHLGCGTRKHCQQTSTEFNRMEADLHNLWPSEAQANNLRSNHLYAVIPGEDWAFEDCDLEISGSGADKVVEPREIARGNLARSILYMHVEYDLPVDPTLGALLKQWNDADPPSADERRRNGVIESLEGKRNPFIDDPSRGDAVNF